MRARLLALTLLSTSLAGLAQRALAQQSDDVLVSTAREWGGQGGVYTCASSGAPMSRASIASATRAIAASSRPPISSA